MMNRRRFVHGVLAAGAAGVAAGRGAQAQRRPVRVLVWDEQQPAQKEAYPNFLGNAIADHLKSRGNDFAVRSVRLDDPQQGLAASELDATDVLVWWGHVRHGEVTPETARGLVERIRSGRLSLLALHSAHWANPFIEAMNARAIDDAKASLSAAESGSVRIRTVPAPRRLMRADEPLTPSFRKTTLPDGAVELEVRLPSCVFVVVRNDGKPSHVRTLLPSHPIARGVPAAFDIPQTEVYGGPFHVPKPDAVIFEERWDAGESFPAGCLWKLGRGEVFYFRPGHETYPIFRQEVPLRIVENACRYLGRGR